jgi:hypothetical protein
MNKNEMDLEIERFLTSGGVIDILRYSDKKAQAKAQRMEYHRDREDRGSEKSKEFLANMRERESTMIFSKTERWKK